MRGNASNPLLPSQPGHTSCRPVPATIQMLTNRRLRILFLKKQRSPAVLHVHFGNQQFVMPVDFDVPLEVLTFLGLGQYRNHSGVYQVHEDHDYIMVDV